MPTPKKSSTPRRSTPKKTRSSLDELEAAQAASLLEEVMSSFRSPKGSHDAKVPCRYGTKCYNHNPEHRAKYSHPSAVTPTGSCAPCRVPCRYGAKCYNHNPEHRAKYSHPAAAASPNPSAGAAATKIQALTRGKSDRKLLSSGGGVPRARSSGGPVQGRGSAHLAEAKQAQAANRAIRGYLGDLAAIEAGSAPAAGPGVAAAASRIQALQRGKSERTLLAKAAREKARAYGNQAQEQAFKGGGFPGVFERLAGAKAGGESASHTRTDVPRVPCKHGAQCRNRSAAHREACEHPLDLRAELAPIIGLESVKKELLALQESLAISLARRQQGMPVPQTKPLHMVFKGRPGCGKTMIGELVGRLLHQLGATSSDRFVEVQRTDLVGTVIGATALATRERIDAAKGGVLFIDEAYRLTSTGSSKDFGREALEEVMRDMTSGDPLVIVAGYPEAMTSFLEANAGLESRFGYVFDFPNYSTHELSRIFFEKAASEGFAMATDVSEDAVAAAITHSTSSEWRELRNGGVADLLLRQTARAQDVRLLSSLGARAITREAASTLALADVLAACAQLETSQDGNDDAGGGLGGSVGGGLRGGMEPLLPPDSREGRVHAQLELELARLVGLEPFKRVVRSLPSSLFMEGLRARLHAPAVKRGALHTVLSGPPGVGKTLAARFLGRVLHKLGAVRSPKFVEVQRRDLVGDRVGQTGVKTREKIEEAKGGIIFVDEAYTLTVEDSDKDFGREAVDELMKDMLSGDPVVIIAGYPDEMARFLRSNAGLARRFEHTLTLADYSPAELGRIFAVKSADAGFGVAEELSDGSLVGELLERCTSAAWRASSSAGNARLAERLYHLAYEALARRSPHATTFVRDDVERAVAGLAELDRQWHSRQ